MSQNNKNNLFRMDRKMQHSILFFLSREYPQSTPLKKVVGYQNNNYFIGTIKYLEELQLLKLYYCENGNISSVSITSKGLDLLEGIYENAGSFGSIFSGNLL